MTPDQELRADLLRKELQLHDELAVVGLRLAEVHYRAGSEIAQRLEQLEPHNAHHSARNR